MKAMQYEAPETIDQAIALLAEATGEGRMLAGGTDLLVQMGTGRISPGVVIDIKRIAELRKMTSVDGGFHIGAAVAGAEAHENAAFVAAWPGLMEGWDLIGSTQIQGRATLGGNLCNASPAADSVPAMIAASATCTVVGPKGTREIPVEAVCTGPGKTSLAPGEFISFINLPARVPRSADAYLRFIPRTEMDIAVVGVGVNLTVDEEGTCTAARVSLGAVAPTALLVNDAADAIIGTKLDENALDKLAAACSAACKPINDKRGTVAYRVKVAGVLGRRAALIALERAKARG
jgi:carbon-monoxide dehydrogenase medium subunit